MKKWLISFALLLIIIGFREQIYRLLVSYEVQTERDWRREDDAMMTKLADSLHKQSTGLDEYVQNVQELTAHRLSFTAKNGGSTAAVVWQSRHGNCTGYAKLTAALLNQHLSEYEEAFAYQAVAKLHFLGFNLHRLFDRPFFKDHDVVVIKANTGRVLRVIDPSLYDYTLIESVRLKH